MKEGEGEEWMRGGEGMKEGEGEERETGRENGWGGKVERGMGGDNDNKGHTCTQGLQ